MTDFTFCNLIQPIFWDILLLNGKLQLWKDLVHLLHLLNATDGESRVAILYSYTHTHTHVW